MWFEIKKILSFISIFVSHTLTNTKKDDLEDKPKVTSDSLDKESKNIVELYEISNTKIQFFENLLKQLKVNRNLKIIELKSKLKKENSLS